MNEPKRRPPRLVCIIDALTLGGAQRSLVAIANRAADRGAHVVIVTLRPTETIPTPLKLNQRVVVRMLDTHPGDSPIPLKPCAVIGVIRRLRRVIAELEPSCLLSFLDETNLLTLLAVGSERRSYRVIVSERSYPGASFKKRYDPLHLLPLLGHAVRRYLYPRADVVVTLTERGADFLRSEGLSNIEVIPNPVPPPPHNEEVKALEPRIIAIGRLAREKRFDLLIEAFAMIAPSFPDWTLSIYGEGPLRERLEWEISRRHLAGQVELRGGLDSPYAALSSRPVFALTSDVEGFPVALSEAMASGCAVVATDCPTGPRELIAHGENGLLVRPRDAAALAGAFQAIFSSEILRRKLGEGARLITARYPPDMIFGRWWDEISAPPRARP